MPSRAFDNIALGQHRAPVETAVPGTMMGTGLLERQQPQPINGCADNVLLDSISAVSSSYRPAYCHEVSLAVTDIGTQVYDAKQAHFSRKWSHYLEVAVEVALAALGYCNFSSLIGSYQLITDRRIGPLDRRRLFDCAAPSSGISLSINNPWTDKIRTRPSSFNGIFHGLTKYERARRRSQSRRDFFPQASD
ncbi:hypothetical protein DM02DRAFT_656578 [Periconia macrospinosa]|uniref:Uncharacterized protein n=1 Tax=Periconia macrospinosa TaxID=97972 RepID=A0A2V1DPX2_9PLEO|nr:hypothetical protein DM02DRAFT_656578 [Periconia macrospinosa]